MYGEGRSKVVKKMQEDKRQILNVFVLVGISFLIVFLTFVFSMQCVPNLLDNGDSGTDSSVFRTIAMLMDCGYIPYRDTFDHKGPLIYILNWIGLQIAYYRGIWVVEFGALLVTFVFIYKMARLLCNKGMSLLILIIVASSLYQYFDGGNLVEEFALPFITISLYCYTKYFLTGNIKNWYIFLCGGCFGAVCLLRPNMVVIWGVFSLAVIIKCLSKKQYKNLFQFCGLFIGGMGIFVLPVLIWLFINHAFDDFIYDYFIFNLKYSGAGSNIFFSRILSFMHFLNDILVLGAIIILGYQIQREKYLSISYGISFLLALYAVSMSGEYYAHYGMILVPMLVYPLGILGRKCSIKDGNFAYSFAKSAITYLVIIVALPVWIGGMEHVVMCMLNSQENSRSQLTMNVVESVVNHTEEDDKITVFGNWDIVYLLSGREPASKYSYQFPIGNVEPDIMEEYFQQINMTSPKAIVWQEAPEDMRMQDFIEKKDYKQVFSSEEGVRIFVLE